MRTPNFVTKSDINVSNLRSQYLALAPKVDTDTNPG